MEAHPAGHPEPLGERLQARAVGAVAVDGEQRRGAGGGEPRHRLEQQVDALVLEQPSGEEQRRGRALGSGGAARRGALHGREVDAAWQHLDGPATLRRDAGAGQLAGGERGGAEPCHHRLGQPVHRRRHRTHVAPPVGAPVLVPGDGQRPPGGAAARRQPRHVGVRHVGGLDEVEGRERDAAHGPGEAERAAVAAPAGGVVEPARVAQREALDAGRHLGRGGAEAGHRHPMPASGEGARHLQVAGLDPAHVVGGERLVDEEEPQAGGVALPRRGRRRAPVRRGLRRVATDGAVRRDAHRAPMSVASSAARRLIEESTAPQVSDSALRMKSAAASTASGRRCTRPVRR